MTTRVTNVLVTIALLGAGACSDGTMASGPIVPPSHVLGVVRGTVRGMTMDAEFVPGSSDWSPATAFSPAIYGGAATVKVSGTVDSLVNLPGSRHWVIRFHMRNLLSYPIGANAGAAIPTDTGGVFLVFTQLPVVSEPYNCIIDGCNITLTNQMGAANFGSPGQPYFWFHSRPTAVQGSPSTDTTADDTLKFMTTSVTPPDTTGAFTFVLMVSAQWPPPNETKSITTYDGTADSLPDTQASPYWKKFAVTGVPTLGTEVFTGGAQLQTVANTNAKSIYFMRNDSMGTGASNFFIEARLQLVNVSANTVQAVLGFVEPGGKQAFIGVASNRVSLATYNNGTGQWSARGSTLANVGTAYHTYRLRKLSNTDVHFCVDGVDTGLSMTYANLQASQATLAGRQEMWGIDGRAAPGVTVNWTSVSYELGNDGGSC